MINEKKLELLILSDILGEYIEELDEATLVYDDKVYDVSKMIARFKELRKEFLSPYTID